jgi:hypothetical protein
MNRTTGRHFCAYRGGPPAAAPITPRTCILPNTVMTISPLGPTGKPEAHFPAALAPAVATLVRGLIDLTSHI